MFVVFCTSHAGHLISYSDVYVYRESTLDMGACGVFGTATISHPCISSESTALHAATTRAAEARAPPNTSEIWSDPSYLCKDNLAKRTYSRTQYRKVPNS